MDRVPVKCPHCNQTISLMGWQYEEIYCPACSGSFRVIDLPEPVFAEQLRHVGKFELIECVGVGAFGTVWKARDTELERLVAIKIPHIGSLAQRSDEERFLREARTAAQLRHPNILSVFDVGRHEGVPYLVCELVEGITLADLMKNRRLAFRTAAELIADVAEALEYAHANGVVHRDIKPSNIMLRIANLTLADEGQSESLGKPLVMDFGIALRSEVDTMITLDGQVLGTPAYMSPEQAGGLSHKVDRRSDIYSLGVVLYHLLAGELPFRGNNRMVIEQVLHEDPRPPRRLNDRIPAELETIVMKCMAKERSWRYQTAAELAADLRRWLAGEPIEARPISWGARAWIWCHRPERIRDSGVFTIIMGTALTGWAIFAFVILWAGVGTPSSVSKADAITELFMVVGAFYLPLIVIGIGVLARRLSALWIGAALALVDFVVAILWALQDRFGIRADMGGLYRDAGTRIQVASLLAILSAALFWGHLVALVSWYHSRRLMAWSKPPDQPHPPAPSTMIRKPTTPADSTRQA